MALSMVEKESSIQMEQPATASELSPTATPTSTEEISATNEVPSVAIPSVVKKSKWAVVKAANNSIFPRQSLGEAKLRSILDELNKLSAQVENGGPNEMPSNSSWNWVRRSRKYLADFVQQPKFHYVIIILIVVDLLVVFVDLVLAQLSLPCLTDDEMEMYNITQQRDECLLENSVPLHSGELFLYYFSVTLLTLFVLEVFVSFYAFGWAHFKKPLYLLDAAIVFASYVMEIYFHFGNVGRAGRAAAAFVVLRLWKIVRAIHAIAHSISLKNRLLVKRIEEARTILKEEKEQVEQTLEKQEIKLDYLMDWLRKAGKQPTPEQIDKYVEKTWQQRKNAEKANTITVIK